MENHKGHLESQVKDTVVSPLTVDLLQHLDLLLQEDNHTSSTSAFYEPQ